jgi:hypothetical protein
MTAMKSEIATGLARGRRSGGDLAGDRRLELLVAEFGWQGRANRVAARRGRSRRVPL